MEELGNVDSQAELSLSRITPLSPHPSVLIGMPKYMLTYLDRSLTTSCLLATLTCDYFP